MIELSEQDIRKITEEALKQLGTAATPDAIGKVVKEAVSRMEPGSKPVYRKPTPAAAGNRVIITAFGKNQIGILSGLTTTLANLKCDVLDLTQKLLQEFFTIMLLVDIAPSDFEFEKIKTEITNTGEKLDLKVIVQHEEIFNTMHRV